MRFFISKQNTLENDKTFMKPKPVYKGPFFEIAKNTGITPHNIEEIVLDHTDMTEIGVNDLSNFVNLSHLYIPYNHLKILNHLELNTRISFLDARNNQITDLDLSHQHFIHELYLSNNKLRDLEKILSKISHLRELKVLDLRNNPLTLEKGYRMTVIRTFPVLQTLDGLDVSTRERPVRLHCSPMMPPKPVSRQAGRRPSSVLEVLKSRPLTAADIVVQNKAHEIKKRHQEQIDQQKARETAIAREQKEKFEEAARKRTCPIPDSFKKMLGIYDEEPEVPPPIPKKRPQTRMFIKKPQLSTIESFTEDEIRSNALNPELPVSKTRVTYQLLFPSQK